MDAGGRGWFALRALILTNKNIDIIRPSIPSYKMGSVSHL